MNGRETTALTPPHLSILDERFDYFEERWITVGTTRDKAVVVVARLYFTDEAEELIRIISAREAKKKGVDRLHSRSILNLIYYLLPIAVIASTVRFCLCHVYRQSPAL